MQGNAFTPKPDRAGHRTGLVFTRDETLGRTIDREVKPICRIETITASAKEALLAVECNEIQTCFVHVPDDAHENGMALARQLRRSHPGSSVFLVAEKKDPDLILEGLRLGVSDVILPATNGDDRFLPVLQKALGPSAAEDRNGFVYALFSLKGGQGVTVTSVNLADQIHDLTGGRVLLLDLNLYLGDVGTMVGIEPDFTPFDLIRDFSRMDEHLLFSSLGRHERGFYVLPSPAAVSDAQRVHRDQIADILSLLKRQFSHIVIDLPHDMSERTLATMEAADFSMVLVTPDLVSVKSAQQVMNFFKELNYGEHRIGYVINRLQGKGELSAEDVEMAMEQPPVAGLADDSRALARAIANGDPLGAEYGRRRITRDFRRLATRLTGIEEHRSRGGWREWLKRP